MDDNEKNKKLIDGVMGEPFCISCALCGKMIKDRTFVPKMVTYEGMTVHFCSRRCKFVYGKVYNKRSKRPAPSSF